MVDSILKKSSSRLGFFSNEWLICNMLNLRSVILIQRYLKINLASIAEDHCHKERNEDIDRKARRKLIIASALCVIFMIMEIVG